MCCEEGNSRGMNDYVHGIPGLGQRFSSQTEEHEGQMMEPW